MASPKGPEVEGNARDGESFHPLPNEYIKIIIERKNFTIGRRTE